MTEENTREPKKRATSKKTTKKVTAKKAVTKKISPPKNPLPKPNSNSLPVDIRAEVRSNSNHNKLVKMTLVIAITAVISSLLTYFTIKASNENPMKSDQITFTAQTSGGVALSESELISIVKKLNRVVFWSGPQKNAKYTINASAKGQIYLRYLPNGQGLSDTNANYRVIATYDVQDAFKSTQAAANQSNGISLSNPDGAAVFYNKATPTNVYMAYPNLNYQIEIFDPHENTSINLASTSGTITKIK